MRNFRKFFLSSLLLIAPGALANNPIAGNLFTDGNGIAAAQAAAPMWYMASGTCMPSAAEDGQGHQTNGVDPDYCNLSKLGNNCPPQPAWQGEQTLYANISGEPFADIPTYYAAGYCDGDSTWRIVYYVYFKKDTGHKSDWEGIVTIFTDPNNDTNWVRDRVLMEQDGSHPPVDWNEIDDTFDGDDDWSEFGNKSRDHAKFYFGKWHHSVHPGWHTGTFKDTCPPNSADDFRNDDYQFWSLRNLRHTDVLNDDWVWGQADPPNKIDVCSY